MLVGTRRREAAARGAMTRALSMRAVVLALGMSTCALPLLADDDAAPPDEGEPSHEGKTAEAVVWRTALGEALAEARRTGRPVLLIATDGSTWCERLEQETLAEDEVASFLREAVVAAKVDLRRSPESGRRLSVTSGPVVIVLEPGGDEAGRIEGFRPPERFLQEARRLATAARALMALRAEAEAKPGDAPAQLAYARALLAAGSLTAARERLRSAADRFPGDAGLALDLAEVTRREGKFAEAADLYRRALGGELGPDDRAAGTAALARCLVSLGKLEEALQAAQTPADAPPERRQEVLFLRAWIRAAEGKAKESLEEIEAARQIDPSTPFGERAAAILESASAHAPRAPRAPTGDPGSK